MLLEAGADPNLIVRDEEGNQITALDIALKIGERGEASAAVLNQANAKTAHSIRQMMMHDDEL